MTEPSRFTNLLQGAIHAWEAKCAVVPFDGADRAELRDGDKLIATVSRTEEPFGTVWRIESARGGRAVVHVSIVPTLRDLRTLLCPDRPGGKILFLREKPS